MKIFNFTEFLNESKRFIVKSPGSDQEYYVKIPDSKKHELVRMETNEEQINRWISELGDSIKLNFKRIKTMNDRNILATSILYRLIKFDTISNAEYEFLTEVTYDNLKAIGIIVISSPIIPGGMYTLPVLFKIANKYNIDLYPEVWNLIKADNIEMKELPSYTKKLNKKKDLEDAIQRYSGIYKNNSDKVIKLEDKIRNIDNFLNNYDK